MLSVTVEVTLHKIACVQVDLLCRKFHSVIKEIALRVSASS